MKDKKMLTFKETYLSAYGMSGNKDDEGWFGTEFPEGVDELYFQVTGIIKDVERLKTLYYLFAEVLNQLCIMGSAYEEGPSINLK